MGAPGYVVRGSSVRCRYASIHHSCSDHTPPAARCPANYQFTISTNMLRSSEGMKDGGSTSVLQSIPSSLHHPSLIVPLRVCPSSSTSAAGDAIFTRLFPGKFWFGLAIFYGMAYKGASL